MATDTPRWKIVLDDKEYIFDPFRDLTVGELRHIKQWYGPDLGRLGPFVVAFGQGDPDAIACAVWVMRRKAGETNVPEPRQLGDIEVGTFMSDMEQLVAPAEPDPTGAATETPGSTRTSTSSATTGLDSSPTSATSHPETSTTSDSSTS